MGSSDLRYYLQKKKKEFKRESVETERTTVLFKDLKYLEKLNKFSINGK